MTRLGLRAVLVVDEDRYGNSKDELRAVNKWIGTIRITKRTVLPVSSST